MRRIADLLRLDDRLAVVTGGAGHVGLAIGEALVEAGATVLVVDLTSEACEARAAALTRHGPGVGLAHPANITVADDVARLMSRVEEDFGRIDILVNNAALTGASSLTGYAVDFADQTVQAWEAAIAVNLTAAFALSSASRRWLDVSEGASIINIGSIYGQVGPMPRLYEGTRMGNPAAYGASKAGLLGLTRYLATVLAPGIRVNAVAPGGIARDQPEAFAARYRELVPLGRMATEEDLKGVIAYLASDASAYVTGQVVTVDGGWTAW